MRHVGRTASRARQPGGTGSVIRAACWYSCPCEWLIPSKRRDKASDEQARAGWETRRNPKALWLQAGTASSAAIPTGITLGTILGLIRIVRITLWQQLGFYDDGELWGLIALTAGASPSRDRDLRLTRRVDAALRAP